MTAMEGSIPGDALSASAAALLGQGEVRVEGAPKVTGAARYTADVRLPGMLWARFLLSPLPHARIRAIDVTRARAVPGVRAVLTGADVRGARFGRRLMDWPVLAWDRVRFVGDRVAAVAAETREAAEEALAAIAVDYEELPAVFDPEEALRPDAPVLHPEAAEYHYFGRGRPAAAYPNQHGYLLVQAGDPDIERALAEADRVFEHVFTAPRQHAAALEPRAAVVWIERDGTVRVTSTNKAPFVLREQFALATGVPEEQVVVDNGFIGGDFGGKGLSLDEYACYFLARATGRPVRAVTRYADELGATNSRHAAVIRLRTGVDRQGRFVAHHADVLFNGGAYCAGKPAPTLVPAGGVATLAPYRVPHVRIELRSVYTNTLPAGHVRAPGEEQAAFAGESHVDMIARELGMDPLEFRLLNAVREGDVGAAGHRFRQARAVEVLEALRRETGWGREAPPAGRGRGMSLAVRHVGSGKTTVVVRLRRDGQIEALTGLPDQGAGAHTLIQRVAAAALGVAPSRVVVVRGDTASVPFDMGAGGSRVSHMVGEATRRAAVQFKQRLEDLACEVLGWPAGQGRLEGERFVATDGSGETAAFAQVAERIARGAPLEVQAEYDATAHAAHEPGDYDFAAYLAEVAVDRETGEVRVLGVTLVADVGTIINPVAHAGQLRGGFVFGLGQALMEDLRVEDGRVVTLSLGDYKLPTVADAPPLRLVLLPTPVGPGPFGAKMAGELSNTGVAPALANAIAAAVGARVTALPLTAERILAALPDA